MEFEIYFSELDKETQDALLKFMGVDKPEDLNWDRFPIALISKGEYDAKD